MVLNNQKTIASVQINAELTASDLDALISELAEVRAQMDPSVAKSRPDPQDPLTMDTPVTMEDSPAMMAIRLKDGRIRFWARSAGFGWLAFNLSEQEAMLIRDYLIANLPERASDLFGDSDPQRH
jgi:hypothetical protein